MELFSKVPLLKQLTEHKELDQHAPAVQCTIIGCLNVEYQYTWIQRQLYPLLHRGYSSSHQARGAFILKERLFEFHSHASALRDTVFVDNSSGLRLATDLGCSAFA